MKALWPVLGLTLLCLAPPPCSGDTPKKKEGPTYRVPYRLTGTLHVLVRVKIDGKGPFNFIVDTGAPLMYVTHEVARKIGLKADKKGRTTLDRLDIEGGVRLDKVKAVVETPFQIEGMNGMGLAGVELHGILGYTLLARFRLGFDFTQDKLTWTKLAFDPPPPQPLGKGPPPDLGAMAFVVKALAWVVGKQPFPKLTPRGFLGVELAEGDGAVTVKAVLAKGPADRAGLRAGDRLQQVQGKEVRSAADVHRLTARVMAGKEVRLRVRRGDKDQEITITAGEGL
jgi:membrane-associated protease RseP (regulator of RpoE activity)